MKPILNKNDLIDAISDAISNEDIESLQAYWKKYPGSINVEICNNKTLECDTPLTMAVRLKKISVIKACLKEPNVAVNVFPNWDKCDLWGDVFAARDQADCALLLAVRQGNTEIVKLLLQHPKTEIIIPGFYARGKSINDRTAFLIAVQRREYDIVNEFIRSGKDLLINCVPSSDSCRTAFGTAVANNDIRMVKILKNLPGVNPNLGKQLYGCSGTFIYGSPLIDAIERALSRGSSDDQLSYLEPNLEIIELLLGMEGIRINDQVNMGPDKTEPTTTRYVTPLDCALNFKSNHISPVRSRVIQLLLSHEQVNLDVYKKKYLFEKILSLHNKSIVIDLLKQALNPTTSLGIRFWQQGGRMPWDKACCLEAGFLKKICEKLKTLDPGFNPKAPKYEMYLNNRLSVCWKKETNTDMLNDDEAESRFTYRL